MQSSFARFAAAIVFGLIACTAIDSAQARLFGRRAESEEQVPAPDAIAQGPVAGPMFSLNANPMVAPPNYVDARTMYPEISGNPSFAGYPSVMGYPNMAGPGAACCPTPCIKYRHAGICKVKCCLPPIQTSLCVNDPCTCCPVNIPVCLPGCCSDAPTVSGRPGLLGNGIVTYDWCCGVTVTVRFQRSGDVLVTYRGA